jgi:pimeloyl-ACP methyl ester carboxylesterase
MKKVLKWFGISFGGIVLLIIIIVSGMYVHWKNLSAKPFVGKDGKVIPGSVSVMEEIYLGGIKQTIYIRGMDRTKPVILFLHGGPGSPESMAVKYFNGPLEKQFIVVNWDQRGSGKSYSPFIPEETMNPQQFVSDAVDLSEYLKKRFKKEKIYLVGHSWGSLLGIYTIRKRPDLFYAYIGIGQVVNFMENEKLSYEFTLDQARKKRDTAALEELAGISGYYLPENFRFLKLMKQRKYLTKYGGAIYGSDNYDLLFKIDLKDEYSLFDIITFLLGSYKSLSAMWPGLLASTNLEKTDLEFQIPVYFFTGAHDYNVPFELTEKYYKEIKAPKKGIVWFDKSAHMPNFEEPEKFMTELTKVFK